MMRKVQIDGFETSDGKLFVDEADASKHERIHKLTKARNNLLRYHEDTTGTRFTTDIYNRCIQILDDCDLLEDIMEIIK